MMMRMGAYATLVMAVLASGPSPASDHDEFKVKREPIFDFAEKPSVTREGDTVTIAFETKGFCDVTVAIEEKGARSCEAPSGPTGKRLPTPFSGRIVRHLASGVLGPNAPEPFQKNSKRQTIVWDGKDDQGRYVDDLDGVSVRVSLGLKPRFERSLLWEPKRRVSTGCPLIRPGPEGVYVYEGQNLDSLRLFNHDGNYVRTIYPFPASQVKAITDLHWYTFPQDGARLPLKEGFWQTTLLSSGDNAGFHERIGLGYGQYIGYGDDGYAASTFAVRDGRIALVKFYLNRLGGDGSTGGLPLKGPRTSLVKTSTHRRFGREPFDVSPWGSAFSPDGRTLYLSGYAFRLRWHWDCLHGVMRLNFDRDDPVRIFKGGFGYEDAGTDAGHFTCASDVACDGQGRVYVADHMNDRIQVFAPDGTFLKSIRVFRPAMISIHHKTGDLFVFTWVVHNEHAEKLYSECEEANKPPVQIVPVLTHLGPFADPRPIAEYPLPLPAFSGRQRSGTSVRSGPLWWGIVDSWTDPPTVWIGRMFASRIGHSGMTSTSAAHRMKTALSLEAGTGGQRGIRLYSLTAKGLTLKRDFGPEVVRAVVNDRPPIRARQRLYVNPVDGALIVGECDSGVINQGFHRPLRVDPDTGRVTAYPLPFTCEDFAFDINGLAYLRGFHEIVRYDPRTWREVPFDYGEQRTGVSFAGERAPAIAALALPTHVTLWHRPGFAISPEGHIAVACYATPKALYREFDSGALRAEDGSDRWGYGALSGFGRQWTPAVYPGRLLAKKGASVHVWDQRGRLIYEDAVPGLAAANGIGIDQHDNLYVLASMYRRYDGRRHFNDMTGTLVKFAAPRGTSPKGFAAPRGTSPGGFTPGKAKVLSSVESPVALADPPSRQADLGKGGLKIWAEGAHWLYGGVGFCGQGVGRPGAMAAGGCSCWNCRFCLDYFARSFAPEMDHYSVAVLDSNGNLITRIGRCGNVDDGVPLDPTSGPPNPRRIGGDEVALFYAPYVATHSDRRLFIADPGNARIVSVRLDYHATERVDFRDVPDHRPKR